VLQQSAPSVSAEPYAPRVAVPITGCLNCDAELVGPYCARCGQKQIATDLSLREFLHETTHELTHWEGKVPATIKTLLSKPGLLTVDFLEGRRARWLPPLRLYLICSVAYFVIGSAVDSASGAAQRDVARLTVTDAQGRTAISPEAMQEIERSVPGRLFGRPRIERALQQSDRLTSIVNNSYPKAMFVLLPLFALLTQVAWRRRLPQYPAHLYLALHLHAAWFVALTLMAIPLAFIEVEWPLTLLGIATLAFIAWYTHATLRRVFAQSHVVTIGKLLGVAAVYAAALFGVGLALLAYAIWNI
jgi:hypothetical protein